MSRRRLPLGLIAPIALVVLVVALGALQYRWVGQVSERERDQLRQSLDRRARDFADDFDREIGRAYQVFAPKAGFTPANAERFARKHDEWLASSPFPGLVKTAYYAEAADDDFTLFRYVPSSRQFEKAAWPGALAPVHARLVAQHTSVRPEVTGPAGLITLTTSPVLASVPAILIPETRENPITEQRLPMQAARGGTINMVVTVAKGPNHVVLELDKEFIRSSMLPTLAERHFPDTGTDRFRLSVSAPKSDVLFSRGVAAGQAIDPKSADAAAIFFGLRMEMLRGFASGPLTAFAVEAGQGTLSARQPRGGGAVVQDKMLVERQLAARPNQSFQVVVEQNAASVTSAQVRSAASGWTLRLQHSAGSLDAAVAQARRRNLFLSFGILSVLAASAGLVMINARRSEKLAAQQMDFVATVSHELRTPLAVIRSAAQNLSAGVVHDAGQARRYGDLIESEGRRLTDMVEQVLEHAGLSDAKRRPSAKPVDTAAVVRDVVAASASLEAAADVVFDVNVDRDVPPMLADEDAIRRALHNLIGNALKYAGDGRWVGVTASRGLGKDDGFVLVSVADRGRGIPAEERAHIFEAFYRGRHALDQQVRGNGLGLSLVKHIVEAHAGRVSVTSAAGEGSTFTLHVPAAAGHAGETA